MSESLIPQSEFDYQLLFKQDKLISSLKRLEYNSLKTTALPSRELVKPLDDLIKEHIKLLKLLEENRRWIIYGETICAQSLHKVAVPHLVKYNPRTVEKDYIEPTFTVYDGPQIADLLKEFNGKLEPFLKLP